ncbi:hypothetical protein [Dyella japonica]|uniref:Uncharacterized protein n=1 Tax=Dyella japonica A8 TaxID=1217721 RepID=A0A075JWS1_9GAMM|nr:hypothetical protein [Dyella japonica]AIF46334.1 hypothetical protein HY57_03220 [Dyella japonica A8]
MNLHGIWIAPWHAMRRPTRWMILVFSALLAAGTVAVATLTMRGPGHAYWAPVTAMLLSFGVFMLVAFGLSPCLLLAIDGRQMRLPRLEREASAAVLLYGTLLVLVPGLLIGGTGGYMLNVMAALAAAVASGLAMALLPRTVSFFVWMLPAAFNILQPVLHLPRPVDSAFAPFCGVLTLVFGVTSLVCWRRIMRSAQPYDCTPVLMQLRTGWRGGWGSWGGAGLDPSTQVRRNPAWLRPRLALRQSGPAYPVLSLRIGLGGLFAPLTVAGRLLQLSVVLGSALIVVLQLGSQAAQRNPGHFSENFVHSSLTGLLMWGAGFGGSMMAIMPIAQLMQRWAKQNAELPLLALLPGLGDATRVKRRLLCASLLPPIAAMTGFLILGLMAAVLLHAGALSVCAMLLTLGGGAAFLSAFIVSVIGGRPLGRWPSAGLCVFGYVLFSTSIFIPMLDTEGMVTHQYLVWFAGAWAVLFAVLGWLAWRGWRGLAHRPHPFIANPA